MLRKAPQELHAVEGHLADFAAGPVILVAEPYTMIIDINPGLYSVQYPFDTKGGGAEGQYREYFFKKKLKNH